MDISSLQEFKQPARSTKKPAQEPDFFHLKFFLRPIIEADPSQIIVINSSVIAH